MNYNFKLLLGAILVTTVYGVDAMHEIDDTSWTDTTQSDQAPREREERKQEFQRVRTLSEHDMRYQARTAPNKNEISTDYSEQTRVTFKPKKWKERVSDFFSNIFGKKAKIDDKFITHSLKTRASGRTEKILNTQEDQKLFRSLSEDQQEKSLNRWLTVERNQFEQQQTIDRENYQKDLEDLDNLRNSVQESNGKLIKKSNQAGDEISKILRNLKRNYPGIDSAALKNLSEVNNNILAVKGTDIATNQNKQNILQDAITKLLTLLDPEKFPADRSKIIERDRTALEKSIKIIIDNDKTIRKYDNILKIAGEKVKNDNIQRKLNTQNSFNARLAQFRNEIQSLLPADRKLKYNTKTGQFEYHIKTPSRLIQQLTKASLTTESSSEEIQTQIDEEKGEFERMTPEQKTEELNDIFQAYQESSDSQREIIIKFLKSIRAQIPDDVRETYDAFVSPFVANEENMQTQTSVNDIQPEWAQISGNPTGLQTTVNDQRFANILGDQPTDDPHFDALFARMAEDEKTTPVEVQKSTTNLDDWDRAFAKSIDSETETYTNGVQSQSVINPENQSVSEAGDDFEALLAKKADESK